MENKLRNVIIFISFVLNILFIISSFSSCSELNRERKLKAKEIAARMELEEKMSLFEADTKKLKEELDKCN